MGVENTEADEKSCNGTRNTGLEEKPLKSWSGGEDCFELLATGRAGDEFSRPASIRSTRSSQAPVFEVCGLAGFATRSRAHLGF